MDGVLVAIDGPAGSGKSSVARRVARELGIAEVDTGAAYRAVALLALREGAALDDGAALAALARRVRLTSEGALLDGEPAGEETLRCPEVSAAASKVSAHPEVREVLLFVQRAAAEESQKRGGAVLEGRDIGTVVLPAADLKVFLSASAEERARRRAEQSGAPAEISSIQEAMSVRDRQDSEREASPLKPAEDAVLLDTTGLELDEVVARIMRFVREVCEGKQRDA